MSTSSTARARSCASSRSARSSTQEEVAEALRDVGHEAVQTTVSRDIAQLGLVKVRDAAGRLVYALPGAADLDRLSELTSALRRWALSLDAVREPARRPDAARPRERARAARSTRRGFPTSLGTIAGDDTIIVIARDGVHGRRDRAASSATTWKEIPDEQDSRARLLRRARHELRDRVAEGGLRLRRGDRGARRRRPADRLRAGVRARLRGGRDARSCSIDRRDDFADEQVAKAIQTNALYEGKYPLISALSRPVIADAVAGVALDVGAEATVHGCTGKGNDQLRFELAFKARYPGVRVIAPLRDRIWSRDEEIAYAEARGIPVEAKQESPYSIDDNLFGRAIEAGMLEDPWVAPPEDAFALTSSPSNAPAPVEVVVGFEAGVPGVARRRGAVARGADRGAQRAGRARTGSAGSTWSRTARSGSRAASCTRLRPR